MIQNKPKLSLKMHTFKRSLKKAALAYLCWAAGAAIVIAGVIVSSCSTTQNVRLPAITAQSSNTVLPGKFVWFDLLTKDISAVKQFYGKLFGWQFDTLSGVDKYVLITNQGTRIGGMVIETDNDSAEGEGSIWIGAVSIPNVDRAAVVVEQRGGTVIEGPMTVEDRGRMAVIRDNSGAPVVLLRATGGDPPDTPPTPGGWVWADLFTPDRNASETFYTAVVGYDVKDLHSKSDQLSKILQMDKIMRSGIIEVHWQGVEPNWLPYVWVSDISDTIKRAAQLGGTLLLRHGNTAILKDPPGAVFGIQGPSGE
jgi:predicted enzyme related to lactoylglutathione lyase